MLRQFGLFICFVLMLSLPSRGQVYDVLGDEKVVTIPFHFEANFIIVRVQLNGALPLNFIFDTGAEHTLLFKKTFTDLLGVPYDKQIRVYGSNLESYVNAHIVRNIRFQVAPLNEVNMDFLVMETDYLRMDEMIGLSVDGILGAQFFRHHVVKIDYRRGLITLYKNESFHEPNKKFIPYPISIERNKPYLAARSHINHIDSADLTLLLDTGAGIGLMLHSNTHEKIKVPENYIETSLGLGISGKINGYMGRVEKLNISNFTFTNVIAGFQEIAINAQSDKLIQRNGIIGNQILSRFTIIIDYPNSMVYFKPERRLKKKFEYDKSGLTIGATGTYLNEFQILHVLPNSPANDVGLQVGDRILKINGMPTTFCSLSYVTKIFRKDAGKKVSVVISRNDERIKKKITLRKLL